MRYFGWAVLSFIAIGVFALIGHACSWFGEGATVAREEFGPRRAIQKYEWFRDKNEAIRGVKVKVRTAQAEQSAFIASAGPRDKWTFEDKQEAARLSAVLSATRNILAEMVAEYNANAKKFNHATFLANDLPQVQTEED